MAKLKIAISIEKPLLEEIDALAKEMEVSRSFLFTLASREFIERCKSQKLLEAINAAYSNSPDLNEERLRTQMKSKQQKLI
jgi:metal-responsive CopG/Arc/MetJ family transcriptional regulator